MQPNNVHMYIGNGKYSKYVHTCSGKYRKHVQRQILKGGVFKLTNILLKMEITFLDVISESHWKIVNPTVIFLWVYH